MEFNAEFVKLLLLENGLSMARLGELMDRSPAFVSAYLSGRRMPKPETVVEMLRAAGLSDGQIKRLPIGELYIF